MKAALPGIGLVLFLAIFAREFLFGLAYDFLRVTWDAVKMAFG